MILHKTSKYGTILESNCFTFAAKASQRLRGYGKCQKFDRDQGELKGKICAYRNRVQNIFKKIEKPGKVRQNQKTLCLLLRNF